MKVRLHLFLLLFVLFLLFNFLHLLWEAERHYGQASSSVDQSSVNADKSVSKLSHWWQPAYCEPCEPCLCGDVTQLPLNDLTQIKSLRWLFVSRFVSQRYSRDVAWPTGSNTSRDVQRKTHWSLYWLCWTLAAGEGPPPDDCHWFLTTVYLNFIDSSDLCCRVFSFLKVLPYHFHLLLLLFLLLLLLLLGFGRDGENSGGYLPNADIHIM